MARKYRAALAVGAIAALTVPLALVGGGIDLGAAASVDMVQPTVSSGTGNTAGMISAAVCAIGFLLAAISIPALVMHFTGERKSLESGAGSDPLLNGSIENYCPECGAEVENDFGFCTLCGRMYVRESKRRISGDLAIRNVRYG